MLHDLVNECSVEAAIGEREHYSVEGLEVRDLRWIAPPSGFFDAVELEIHTNYGACSGVENPVGVTPVSTAEIQPAAREVL
jgi:hypothetical protein